MTSSVLSEAGDGSDQILHRLDPVPAARAALVLGNVSDYSDQESPRFNVFK
jgi:hypothetical protein